MADAGDVSVLLGNPFRELSDKFTFSDLYGRQDRLSQCETPEQSSSATPSP